MIFGCECYVLISQYRSSLVTMYSQRFLVPVVLVGLARTANQCISKGVVSEKEKENLPHKKQIKSQRENDLSRQLAQKSAQKSQFQPPQELHYGFNPIPVEGRENFESMLEGKSYKRIEKIQDEDIDLLNIPGPPYQSKIQENLGQQKLLVEEQSTKEKFTINNPGHNHIFIKKSKKKVQREKQIQIPLKSNYHRSYTFQDGARTEEGLRRMVEKFQKFQNFPGFESFDVGFVSKQDFN